MDNATIACNKSLYLYHEPLQKKLSLIRVKNISVRNGMHVHLRLPV